jgi:AraC family transcriptional regulator
MSQPRVIIEPDYVIERRGLQRRSFALAPQPHFTLAHFIASTTENIPAGASLLVNPHESWQFTGGPGACDLLLVRLAPEPLIETAARLQLYRTGSQVLFRGALTPVNDALLRYLLGQIADEIANASPGWREVLGSLVNQLTIHLLRSHVNVKRSEEIELSRVGLVDRRLRRAVEFMHDNCARELGLNEIAEAAYLSPFHFARLFKKITGATPHAYLASLRVERARRLLAETDLTLADVGARVGYESQSHFTKVFREATGLTPRAFREASRQS